MLLVILGAGASYDSLEPLRTSQHEHRPPLATQLFDDRDLFREVENRYPEASRLFPVLREAGRKGSIEAEFDRLQAEMAEYPKRIQQLASLRFYIRRIIEEVSAKWIAGGRVTQLNHNALLEQLDSGKATDDPTLLVTFNYDTFVEQALFRAGRSIASLSEYVRDTPFPLFKLHGSVDWSREITISGAIDRKEFKKGALDEAALVRNASEWSEIDSFVLANTTFVEGRHYVPAIAVPVQTKTSFQCPREHLAVLKQELRHVDRILTIGWKGQEQHFLQLLAASLKQPVRILCVSGDRGRSEETLDRLRSARLLIQHADGADMGFSQLVSSRGVEGFFRG